MREQLLSDVWDVIVSNQKILNRDEMEASLDLPPFGVLRHYTFSHSNILDRLKEENPEEYEIFSVVPELEYSKVLSQSASAVADDDDVYEVTFNLMDDQRRPLSGREDYVQLIGEGIEEGSGPYLDSVVESESTPGAYVASIKSSEAGEFTDASLLVLGQYALDLAPIEFTEE